jgi:hypothetical protein
MATVTERSRTPNLVESHRKVRDPLHHLRGLIRRYVITEALTSLLISLAVCFWLGLLVDYGFFKLFGIDWVQDLPRWFRAMLLGGGLLVVAFVVELRKVLKIRKALTSEVPGATGLFGKVLRNRVSLIVAAIPLVIVYLAAWVGLAVWMDQGGLAPLVIGLLVFALLAAFASLIVVKRLFYEFRDAALALVLERRYPQLLGDRLITAVELHNPAEAEKYGYSPVMVEETIHEAAKRVARLPVREVFDWKRLYLQGGSAIGLTIGIYLLSLVGLMGLTAASEGNTGNVLPDMNRAAGIWFERNVMLDNERWPKRALIQPVDEAPYVFSDKGELKVGKGTSSVPLRARAVEYAIHDRSVPDRWRAVTLRDLREQDLGVSADAIPDEDKLPWKPRDKEAGFTLDEIKLGIDRAKQQQQRLEKEVERQLLGLFLLGSGDKEEVKDLWKRHADLDEQIAAPQALLEEVDRHVSDSNLSRGLRKLIVPDEVTVKYSSANHRGEVTLDKVADNEYKGKIEELSESLSFTLRAENFISDPRKITVVPPPRVVKLKVAESAPAYLYYLAQKDNRALPATYAATAGHLAAPLGPGVLSATASLPPARPLDDDQLLLARKKQDSQPIERAMAGETQPEIRLLTSSDLILHVVTDKPLNPQTLEIDDKGSPLLRSLRAKEIEARKPDKVYKDSKTNRWMIKREDGTEEPTTDPLLRGLETEFLDDETFTVTFRNVRGKIDFRFTFYDTDGVPGAQDILITPTEDESPVIQQFKPEVVRMVGDRYMVTPEALIPFSIVIRDDYGLSRLVYNYSLTEAPAPDEEMRRYARVAGSIGLTLSGPEVPLSALVYNQALPITLQRNEATLEGHFPVAHFQAIINELRAQMNEAAIAEDLRKRVAIRKLRDRVQELTAYVFKEVGDLDPYLKDHKAAVDDPAVPTKGFDVALIRRNDGGIERPLKARELEVQKRYYLQIYLEAFDSNIERAGRGVRPSKQYPFVVVSDTELLYEIGKEEERLYDELRKSYDELVKTREQMMSLRSDIPVNAAEMQKDDFDRFSVRTEAIEKAIREGLRITVKVALDYDRIYREMRTNRIQNTNPKRVNETFDLIVKPLAKLQEDEFRYSQQELTRLRKVLDNSALNDADRLKKSRDVAKLADDQVQLLVTKLGEVLAQMRGVVDYNKVKDLIREIERKETESAARLAKLAKEIEDRLFQGLDSEEEPKKKP